MAAAPQLRSTTEMGCLVVVQIQHSACARSIRPMSSLVVSLLSVEATGSGCSSWAIRFDSSAWTHVRAHRSPSGPP